jgi:predicted ATPase
MLKEIRLKNFKCFREETIFPLSTINLLTGINGRGKSTLLQSMLLMKQSVEHNEYTNKLILNGNCVNLGTYEDLQNSESALGEKIEIGFYYTKWGTTKTHTKYSIGLNLEIKELDISFDINFNSGFECKFEENFKRDYFIELKNKQEKKIFQGNWLVDSILDLDIQKKAVTENFNIKIDNAVVELHNLLPSFSNLIMYNHREAVDKFLKTNPKYNKEVSLYSEIRQMNFYSRIHYVAADRLGSQEYYQKINLNDFISIDKKGENLATVLFELKENLVNDKLYLGKDAKNLEEQVGEWLSQIFDTKVEIEIKDNSNTLELLFTINGKQHKPTNVGFGYSYILPIIVSGLIAKEGEILIIENPEAHLHPKAQSELTKFLAKVASCGVQIFIESHSEHILRGLQVSVLKEDIEINEKDVNILYFHNEKEKDSNFTQIPVNADGSIDKWPNDFFDQADKDYKILFGF